MTTADTVTRSLEILDLSARELRAVADRERSGDPDFALGIDEFAHACEQVTTALQKLSALAADLRLREKEVKDPVWAKSLRESAERLESMANHLAARVEKLSAESAGGGAS